MTNGIIFGVCLTLAISVLPIESELSSESRSFLHRVNDQVRKRQNPILNRRNKRRRKTFFDLVNVHVFNTASICIHGEELLRKFTVHQKLQRKDLTLKQMFDISEKLIVGQSDEIFGVSQISWENSP